jgi:transposase InsO family protein
MLIQTWHPLPLIPGEQIDTSWLIDFMSDVLWDVCHLRTTFNVIDDSRREAAAVELVHRRRGAVREKARRSLFAHTEGCYNRRRIHSALGYRAKERAERQMA